ncbi:MAG: aminoglycoside phosphotransferase family protein [Thermomicrobiales bacterium]
MSSDEKRLLHNGIAIPDHLASTLAQWVNKDEMNLNWLDSLKETVQHFSDRWDITFEQMTPESYVTLVLLGHSSKLGPVAFKSSPMYREFRAEASALRLAGGPDVSRLFDVDFDRCGMVVERIMPGVQLRDAGLADEAATAVFAAKAMLFWMDVEDPAPLHPLRTWMRDLFSWKSIPDRIPDDIIEHARALANELLEAPIVPRLVHGDLQHHNILRRTNGDWAIIDPKGVWGDPAFEVAAWMYNPPGVQEQEDYVNMANRRFDIISAAWGIERAHLVRWAFVGAVLSTVWSAGGPAPDGWFRGSLKVANVMRSMLD